MNPIFFVLLLICCMQSSVLAQETSPKNIDSIYSLEIKAYKLTQQNKIADAMLIGYELLQYGSTENNDSIEAAGYKILGISYSILKDSAKSYKYFKKNRDINLRLKDTSKLINSYNNLGVISMTLSNNVKKSNAYFKRAAKLAYLSGNYDEAIHPNANIASNLINGEKESNIKDQYNLAIGHFNEALSL